MCTADGGIYHAISNVPAASADRGVSASLSLQPFSGAEAEKAPADSNRAAQMHILLRLSPVNAQSTTAIRYLQESDGERVGAEDKMSSEVVLLAMEQWIEKSDVSPAWYLPDTACWCEELGESVDADMNSIPETPSPTKRPEGVRSSSLVPSVQTDSAVSLSSVLHDLSECNAVLLVSMRPSSHLQRSSRSPDSCSSTNNKVGFALMSSISHGGRVGILHFVNGDVINGAAQDGSEVAAAPKDVGTNIGKLPPFASHALEEWNWKPSERFLEMLTSNGTSTPCARDSDANVELPYLENIRTKLMDLAEQPTMPLQADCSAASNSLSSQNNSVQGSKSDRPASAHPGGDGINTATDRYGMPSWEAREEGGRTEGFQGSSVEDVLQELDAVYRGMLGTFLNRCPLEFFEQFIPRCMAHMEGLQGVVSTARTSEVGEESRKMAEKRQDDEIMGANGGSEQEGSKEEVKKGEGILDKKVDPQKAVLQHITQYWIKKKKDWNWQGSGMRKEEARRQHEFQALLRLYVPRLTGKAVVDPIEGVGKTSVLRCVHVCVCVCARAHVHVHASMLLTASKRFSLPELLQCAFNFPRQPISQRKAEVNARASERAHTHIHRHIRTLLTLRAPLAVTSRRFYGRYAAHICRAHWSKSSSTFTLRIPMRAH